MKELITKESGGDFVKRSMYRYGIEVITNRALPRIEDGLKPVQRLSIWATKELKTNNFTKSSKICGNTIGGFHPHGDISAYVALVNMVNDRYGGFEGMGNFGAIDAEAAASRYTEARISPLFRKVSTDLADLAVVPYEPNYDETKTQPVYLPTSLPYLLLVGNEGIAPGIVSRLPSFNLEEVIKAVVKYLETKDIELAVKKIKAPDGDFCKIISSKKEVADVLKTGEGTIEYECRHTLEATNKGFRVVVNGYTADFNLTGFLNKCGKLQDEDLIDVVRNETSAKNGDRIVVDFKDKLVYEKKLLPMMRKKVPYKFNVLFQRGGVLKPEMCSVSKIITEWVEIRRKTVVDTLNREVEDLNKQAVREEAKKKALLNLKEIFKALQAEGDFKEFLIKQLGFTVEQAQMIADMRVESLKSASIKDIEDRLVDLKNAISALEAKLAAPDAVMIEQLKDLLKWADKTQPDFLIRKTQIDW